MSNVEGHELARWLSEAAQELESVEGTAATLDEACQSAVAVVAGCRCAAIGEAPRSAPGDLLAATDRTARELHQAQYDLGDGPVLDTIWTDRIVWSDDLAAEPRWPRFATAAVDRGIRSVVVIQLYTHDDALGALSMYSATPGTFDEVTRDVAQIFAAHAAIAIAGAREHAQLSQALTTRQQIGQATGILAERHHLTTDEAFTLLARSSQNHNIKIRDLAARIVTTEDQSRHQSRAAKHPS